MRNNIQQTPQTTKSVWHALAPINIIHSWILKTWRMVWRLWRWQRLWVWYTYSSSVVSQTSKWPKSQKSIDSSIFTETWSSIFVPFKVSWFCNILKIQSDFFPDFMKLQNCSCSSRPRKRFSRFWLPKTSVSVPKIQCSEIGRRVKESSCTWRERFWTVQINHEKNSTTWFH